MERKDIEEKYTWDLSKIYQDPQEFYHDIEVSQQLLDELTSFQGKKRFYVFYQSVTKCPCL